MLTLKEVREYIFKMSDRIPIRQDSALLPMFSKTKDVFPEGASIYVDDKYHYIIMERGRINKHYESEHLDDILYPLFESITFSLACDYEVKHRREHEDSRRQLWQKQLELLEKIDKHFAETCEEEIKAILKIAPYSY